MTGGARATGEDRTAAADRTRSGVDTGTPLLEVNGLKKYFDMSDGVLDRVLGSTRKVRAVDGVDLTIREEETLAVVGESGCGKTTLGQTILKLHEPTDGEIVYRGDDISDYSSSQMRPMRRNLQMIFQDPLASLNPRKSVGEILRTPLEVHDVGDSRAERDETVARMLQQVGLKPGHADRYPHQFSGGQQQRVGIARALMLDPELVVADEPTSALDVSVQAQILNLLEELQREFGLSMLIINHDLSVVRYIADRVAVMYLGEIVEVAPTDELFENPKHPYTQALLSAVPRIDERSRRDRILLSDSVPSPLDPPEGCRFHTRCPAVIPPGDWAASQPAFRTALDFRRKVEDDEIRRDDIRERLGEDVDEARIAEYVLDQSFGGDLGALPDDVAAVVERAAEEIAREETEAVVDDLRTAIPTPCQDQVPTTLAAGTDHTVACHRHDPEAPGEPLEE